VGGVQLTMTARVQLMRQRIARALVRLACRIDSRPDVEYSVPPSWRRPGARKIRRVDWVQPWMIGRLKL